MKYKYGEFSSSQISDTKEYIRKQIFFLLLIVDPKTKDKYPNVDAALAIDSMQTKIGGLNSILLEPPELVTVSGLLEAALHEIQKEDFDFYKSRYRKLILDAGAEVKKIKEE